MKNHGGNRAKFRAIFVFDLLQKQLSSAKVQWKNPYLFFIFRSVC